MRSKKPTSTKPTRKHIPEQSQHAMIYGNVGGVGVLAFDDNTFDVWCTLSVNVPEARLERLTLENLKELESCIRKVRKLVKGK